MALEQLLYPHIKQIITINGRARNPADGGAGLIDRQGFVLKASHLSHKNIHEIFDAVLESWTPDVLNLPKYLELSGLNETSFPFPYALRDDGTKYWNLIHEYVATIVEFYYGESDEKVYYGKYGYLQYCII